MEVEPSYRIRRDIFGYSLRTSDNYSVWHRDGVFLIARFDRKALYLMCIGFICSLKLDVFLDKFYPPGSHHG